MDILSWLDAQSAKEAVALRDELAALRKEAQDSRALLADIDANMRRAWKDRSLSANAWPTALAQRLANAVGPLV